MCVRAMHAALAAPRSGRRPASPPAARVSPLLNASQHMEGACEAASGSGAPTVIVLVRPARAPRGARGGHLITSRGAHSSLMRTCGCTWRWTASPRLPPRSRCWNQWRCAGGGCRSSARLPCPAGANARARDFSSHRSRGGRGGRGGGGGGGGAAAASTRSRMCLSGARLRCAAHVRGGGGDCVPRRVRVRSAARRYLARASGGWPCASLPRAP